MQYINLSGYPLRVDGLVLPVKGRVQVRCVDVEDSEELHYDGMTRPEGGTVVILPPEADEYGAVPTYGHALPDELKWDAEDRVFDCVLDIYGVEESKPPFTISGFTNDTIQQVSLNFSEIYYTPREAPTVDFSKKVMSDIKLDLSSAYRVIDDRLEELVYLYDLTFSDYAKVRSAFKESLSSERLVYASTDKTYADRFFYNFFGIDGPVPKPHNAFQAKAHKG